MARLVAPVERGRPTPLGRDNNDAVIQTASAAPLLGHVESNPIPSGPTREGN